MIKHRISKARVQRTCSAIFAICKRKYKSHNGAKKSGFKTFQTERIILDVVVPVLIVSFDV